MQDESNQGGRPTLSARRVKVEGERGIYLRPGTSPVVYEITWAESGRQHWRTIEGGLREARAARGDAVAKLARGERVARSKLTVAEYAETWIEAQEGRLRPKTLRTYRDHLRLHIVPKLGRRKLASITVDDVAGLLADCSRAGLAAWTQRGILTVLGRMLASATRSGLVPTNVAVQLERSERPRVRKAEFPSLDREAVGRLIAATPGKYRELVRSRCCSGCGRGKPWAALAGRGHVGRGAAGSASARRPHRGAGRAEDAGGEARRADAAVAGEDARRAPAGVALVERERSRVRVLGGDAGCGSEHREARSGTGACRCGVAAPALA